MPNGGFGCGYCTHLRGRFCTLRKIKIRNDHWVVCNNVNYYENLASARLNQFNGKIRKPKISGSVYTITSVEGAYSQVPWLGSNQVYESLKPGDPNEFSIFQCEECNRDVIQPRNVYVKLDGKLSRFHFCSWNHYLVWRNVLIERGVIEDELMSSEKLARYKDFTDLEIISSNSNHLRREKSVRIYLMRQLAMKIIKYTLITALLMLLIAKLFL